MNKVMVGVFVCAMVLVGAIVYAENRQSGDNDFLSSSLADMFNKVHEYTSGEKTIISDNAEGMNKGLEFGGSSTITDRTRPPKKQGDENEAVTSQKESPKEGSAI